MILYKQVREACGLRQIDLARAGNISQNHFRIMETEGAVSNNIKAKLILAYDKLGYDFQDVWRLEYLRHRVEQLKLEGII